VRQQRLIQEQNHRGSIRITVQRAQQAAQNGADAQQRCGLQAPWHAPAPRWLVTVRWPILRPLLAFELAVQMQMPPGKASTASHGGVPVVPSSATQVAQQVEHDGRAVLARLRQRQAGQVRTCSSNCDTSQASMCSGRCCAGAAPSR
jgi:hypothetical protein